MKTCARGGTAPPFLTSVLDRGEWSASWPSQFTHSTHWIRDWVGSRTSLDSMKKEKTPCPFQESNPGCPVCTPFCTDWTTPAIIIIYLLFKLSICNYCLTSYLLLLPSWVQCATDFWNHVHKVTWMLWAVLNNHISLPSRWLSTATLTWHSTGCCVIIMLHSSILLQHVFYHLIYVYVHIHSFQFSFLCAFCFNHYYFMPYFHYYTTQFGLTGTIVRFVCSWRTDNALKN
jgi:hypothetical protein